MKTYSYRVGTRGEKIDGKQQNIVPKRASGTPLLVYELAIAH